MKAFKCIREINRNAIQTSKARNKKLKVIYLKKYLQTSLVLRTGLASWFLHSALICNLILYSMILSAEPGDTLRDNIFLNRVKTVLLHKDGWELSYPVINLGTSEKLKLSFDELTKSRTEYHYLIKHCSLDWIEDDLETLEYMDSPTDNRISTSSFSFSTYTAYVHYELIFPTSDWEFHRSGNYIIMVYDQDPKKPVLTKRFMICENRLDFNITVRKSNEESPDENAQALDIKLQLPEYDNEHLSEIPVLVVNQNGNWYNSGIFTEPMLSGGTELEFRLDGRDAFPGLNEFRNFDIKSVKYMSPNIQNISFINNSFQIGLHPEKSRQYNPYFFDNDLNGKSLIKIQEGENSGTDADYVDVYFTLSVLQPITEGKLYVTGAFCLWKTDEENCLKFNPKSVSYELSMQLKQGYYNYLYAFIKKGSHKVDFSEIEGSHFETENDYLIMAYQKDTRGYDRLTGFRIFNTLNKK
jgi:Domain of unknown function (DUF5103)